MIDKTTKDIPIISLLKTLPDFIKKDLKNLKLKYHMVIQI